jgi:hypothetical protein
LNDWNVWNQPQHALAIERFEHLRRTRPRGERSVAIERLERLERLERAPFYLPAQSQTANRNGFRPASVSHRQLTLLNLMITAVQPLYGVGDHARANHVQVDVDQTVMQVFVGLIAVAW